MLQFTHLFQEISTFSSIKQHHLFFFDHPTLLPGGLRPTPGPLPFQGWLQLTTGSDRPSSGFGMALKLSPLRGSPCLSFGWRDVCLLRIIVVRLRRRNLTNLFKSSKIFVVCSICFDFVRFLRDSALLVNTAPADKTPSRTSDGPSLPSLGLWTLATNGTQE